jgi:hypothetical protein
MTGQSNLPNPDYSAESFGQPQYSEPMYQEPKKSRTGRNVLLLSCGGLVGVTALCVCCCFALIAFSATTAPGAVLFWGVGGQTETWSFSRNFVCDGSQAAELTDFYEAEGYFFTDFSANQDTTTGDDVIGEGMIEVNGVPRNFRARFTTSGDGGLFGTCVETINVTSGPSLP